jgi:hypothetical protein
VCVFFLPLSWSIGCGETETEGLALRYVCLVYVAAIKSLDDLGERGWEYEPEETKDVECICLPGSLHRLIYAA